MKKRELLTYCLILAGFLVLISRPTQYDTNRMEQVYGAEVQQ